LKVDAPEDRTFEPPSSSMRLANFILPKIKMAKWDGRAARWFFNSLRVE
jgi:hypothetical protein